MSAWCQVLLAYRNLPESQLDFRGLSQFRASSEILCSRDFSRVVFQQIIGIWQKSRAKDMRCSVPATITRLKENSRRHARESGDRQRDGRNHSEAYVKKIQLHPAPLSCATLIAATVLHFCCLPCHISEY